jgi:hypothetical protein
MKPDVQNIPPKKMKFWDKFFTMFYEDDSEWWSSIRFGFIFMMILSNVCVWFTWVIISFVQWKLLAIPESVLGLYAIANGIGFGSKVRQKGKELSVVNIVDTVKGNINKSEEENNEEKK